MDAQLSGDTFFLRPWRIKDAEWYVKSRDEAIFKWTTEERDLTVKQTEAAFRAVKREPNSYCFAIFDRTIDALVGNIALSIHDKSKHIAEIMYWLAPEGRGRGIATKSVRLLSDWASQSLGIEQVILKTHLDNEASQRVAARAGFRRWKDTGAERVDREHLWFEYRMKK